MEVHNAVTPTAEQLEGFLAPDAAGPIYMVNLLKLSACRVRRWPGDVAIGARGLRALRR